MTCGKEQNPERFHSHPKHLVKFKAKDKDTKLNSKHAVTKPTALKYRSRSLEGDKTSSKKSTTNEKSKLKQPGVYATKKSNSVVKRKSKSVNNSPVAARKPEKKKPQIDSLKIFIEKRKAAMNKKSSTKDFGIEIFEDKQSDPNELPLPAASKTKVHVKQKKRPKPIKEDGGTTTEDDESEDSIAQLNSSKFSSVTSKMDRISEEKPLSKPSERQKTAPPTRVCYICGREFGSRSLKIHQPQCLEVNSCKIFFVHNSIII